MEPREEQLDPEAAATEDVIVSSEAERTAAAGAFRYILGMSSKKDKVPAEALTRVGVEISGPNAISFAKARGRLAGINDFPYERCPFWVHAFQPGHRRRSIFCHRGPTDTHPPPCHTLQTPTHTSGLHSTSSPRSRRCVTRIAGRPAARQQRLHPHLPCALS